MSDTLEATSDTTASDGGSGGGLTEEHHDWVQSVFGVDPRASSAVADAGAADAGAAAASDSGGGLWGAISGAASAAVASVSDAVGSVENSVSTVASTAVDAASSVASTALNTAESVAGTAADAVTSVAGTAYNAVADVASSAADAVASTGPVGAAIADAARTQVDFGKGLVEGVYEGGKGLVTGVVHGVAAVAKEGYALATDEQAREDAANTVMNASKAVGDFEVEMVTDPGKAWQQTEDAVSGAASTVGKIATNVYHSYEEAAAAGHGAEFLGKGVGQAAVLVGGALIPGVGEAEAGVVAAEGAVAVADVAAVATEGATVVGEGLAVAGDTTAIATEAAESAAALGQAGAATEDLATAGQSVESMETAARSTEDVTSAVEEAPLSEAPESAPESLHPDDARRQDILEEFEERQQQYGGNQAEVADEPPSPDLQEPGRMEELDSGHDRTWEREDAQDRLDQGKRENRSTPADNRGSFVEGNPGDGRWAPHNPGEYGLEEGQSVPFREGTPDFTEFATETPAGHPGTIDVEGLDGLKGGGDRAKTIEALADREGMQGPAEMEKWLADNNQRLHHFGGKEMQIVPKELHALFHEGGASELRAAAEARNMGGAADEALTGLAEADPGAADAMAEFERAEAQRMADLDPEAAAQAEAPPKARMRVADGAEPGGGADPAAAGPQGDPQPQVRVRVATPSPTPTAEAAAQDAQAAQEMAEEQEAAEEAGIAAKAARLKRMRIGE